MPENYFTYRATALILKHLQGELNGQEQDELTRWIEAAPEHKVSFEEMVNPDFLGKELGSIPGLKNRIAEKVYAEIPEARPAIPLYRRSFFRVAAAIFIAVLGTGLYFLLFNKKPQRTEMVQTQPGTDVKAPQTNRAMITLANGGKIFLDSVNSGQLAIQGNVQLMKLPNGEITYQQASGEVSNMMAYNTLFNPKGSQIACLTLADGSKVWLNAGSSLTYPVVFTGQERKVSITGEAYFEVAHNNYMPFKVSKEATEVTVLGTHFNVNAYNDESDIKVTLLQGAVKVVNGRASGLLKPGEQASITTDRVKIEAGIDLEEVMAWKKGKFQFGVQSDITAVMRQLARWYDIEVVYKGTVTGHIWGSISRQANISEVLKMLEMTGSAHFTIENKKVIVMP